MFQRGTNLCGIENVMTTTTASTGDVVQEQFVWTTDGTIQTSSNCDFTLLSGSVSIATVPGTATLAQCKTYCTTTYPSYCNFFTLSTAGVCTLNKSTTKPSPVMSSAKSNCGWVPTRF